MMGFAAKVAYFEARAAGTRDPDRKLSLIEIAVFYRRLAAQRRVSQKALHRPAKTAATDCVIAAEECRTLAEHFKDADCRYQKMAIAAEKAIISI